ncbi:MAG: DUF308 domain-containing protein [Lachnospiraceae bacterium]|nr:DUF308 domain-containing protein [Lachnospiraceae bacterium]
MTRIRKIREILSALFMIALAALIIYSPSEGYYLIIVLLAVIFLMRGVSTLIYYITMARYMVGGRMILFSGIIMLDLGILTGTLTDVPHYYILLYLFAIHAFSGLVEILRAREAAGYGGSWKFKVFQGLTDILVATLCIINIRNMNAAAVIYAAGMIYSAVLRIMSVFRRTKFIYIQ